MTIRRLVAAGMLIGLAACSGGSAAPVILNQTASVEVTGDVLPRFAEPDTGLGLSPPMLEGVDFDGDTVAVDPSTGAQVVLFVAHWCQHCQDEIPEVSEWLAAGSLPDGVTMTIVSTGVDMTAPNYPPSEWLTDAGISVPILLDNSLGVAANAYGLSAFPYWVVIDGDGAVALRHAGRLPIELLDQMVAELGAN